MMEDISLTLHKADFLSTRLIASRTPPRLYTQEECQQNASVRTFAITHWDKLEDLPPFWNPCGSPAKSGEERPTGRNEGVTCVLVFTVIETIYVHF